MTDSTIVAVDTPDGDSSQMKASKSDLSIVYSSPRMESSATTSTACINDVAQPLRRDLSSELLCPLCDHLFDRPVMVTCGHSYCEPCIERHTRNTRSCVICKHDVGPFEAMIPSITLDNMVRKLKNEDIIETSYEDSFTSEDKPQKEIGQQSQQLQNQPLTSPPKLIRTMSQKRRLFFSIAAPTICSRVSTTIGQLFNSNWNGIKGRSQIVLQNLGAKHHVMDVEESLHFDFRAEHFHMLRRSDRETDIALEQMLTEQVRILQAAIAAYRAEKSLSRKDPLQRKVFNEYRLFTKIRNRCINAKAELGERRKRRKKWSCDVPESNYVYGTDDESEKSEESDASVIIIEDDDDPTPIKKSAPKRKTDEVKVPNGSQVLHNDQEAQASSSPYPTRDSRKRIANSRNGSSKAQSNGKTSNGKQEEEDEEVVRRPRRMNKAKQYPLGYAELHDPDEEKAEEDDVEAVHRPRRRNKAKQYPLGYAALHDPDEEEEEEFPITPHRRRPLSPSARPTKSSLKIPPEPLNPYPHSASLSPESSHNDNEDKSSQNDSILAGATTFLFFRRHGFGRRSERFTSATQASFDEVDEMEEEMDSSMRKNSPGKVEETFKNLDENPPKMKRNSFLRRSLNAFRRSGRGYSKRQDAEPTEDSLALIAEEVENQESEVPENTEQKDKKANMKSLWKRLFLGSKKPDNSKKGVQLIRHDKKDEGSFSPSFIRLQNQHDDPPESQQNLKMGNFALGYYMGIGRKFERIAGGSEICVVVFGHAVAGKTTLVRGIRKLFLEGTDHIRIIPLAERYRLAGIGMMPYPEGDNRLPHIVSLAVNSRTDENVQYVLDIIDPEYDNSTLPQAYMDACDAAFLLIDGRNCASLLSAHQIYRNMKGPQHAHVQSELIKNIPSETSSQPHVISSNEMLETSMAKAMTPTREMCATQLNKDDVEEMLITICERVANARKPSSSLPSSSSTPKPTTTAFPTKSKTP